jgi:hypothetical protein
VYLVSKCIDDIARNLGLYLVQKQKKCFVNFELMRFLSRSIRLRQAVRKRIHAKKDGSAVGSSRWQRFDGHIARGVAGDCLPHGADLMLELHLPPSADSVFSLTSLKPSLSIDAISALNCANSISRCQPRPAGADGRKMRRSTNRRRTQMLSAAQNAPACTGRLRQRPPPNRSVELTRSVAQQEGPHLTQLNGVVASEFDVWEDRLESVQQRDRLDVVYETI